MIIIRFSYYSDKNDFLSINNCIIAHFQSIKETEDLAFNNKLANTKSVSFIE